MSRRISIAKARNQMTELIDPAEDLWSAIRRFRQTHDLSDLNVEEIYAGVRDPSPGRDPDE